MAILRLLVIVNLVILYLCVSVRQLHFHPQVTHPPGVLKEVTLGAALSEGLRMKSEDLTNTVAEAHPEYCGKGRHFCFFEVCFVQEELKKCEVKTKW